MAEFDTLEGRWVVRITSSAYDTLRKHLFPGDGDEHGAVLLASLAGC